MKYFAMLLLLASCGDAPREKAKQVTVDMAAPDMGQQGVDLGEPDTGPELLRECVADDECPSTSEAPFYDLFATYCAETLERGQYCRECDWDNECRPGYRCVDRTYCEPYGDCADDLDCTNVDSVAHYWCNGESCGRCDDDAQCAPEEICFATFCIARAAVNPTCLDGTCRNSCSWDIRQGRALGVRCG